MTPKLSLEECLKRYLRDLQGLLYLESTSPPVMESRRDWLAEMDEMREDIACVEHWLARIESVDAAPRLLAALQAILPYAENEIVSLDDLKDDEVSEQEAEKGWKAFSMACEVIREVTGKAA